MKTLRIGAGAGYSGDRIEPAVELADHQRFTIPFLFAASVLMTLTALLLGVI